MNEWKNECLMTPQHKKQIGYWVSEKLVNDSPTKIKKEKGLANINSQADVHDMCHQHVCTGFHSSS